MTQEGNPYTDVGGGIPIMTQEWNPYYDVGVGNPIMMWEGESL